MKKSFGVSVNRFRKRRVKRRYGIAGVKDKNRLRTNLRNLTLCISVVVIVLLLKNMNFSYAHRATRGIKSVITKEYGLRERFLYLRDTVPVIRDKITGVKGPVDPIETMIMPVQGDITSRYGMRLHPVFNVESKHEGIDIAAATGEPVKAVLSGEVVEAGLHPELGNVVAIEHSADLKTLYGHLGKIEVKKNQKVCQGEIIGLIGSSGLSTGSHLHFEVWRDGKPVDPAKEQGLNIIDM